MSVKRYWISPNGIVCEDNEGKFVRYEDHAALEARCTALAAENAGLKQSTPDLKTMMTALDVFFADEEVPERAMLAAYNILRGAVETPDTDAFLAEVRAQGVTMFSDWLIERIHGWQVEGAASEDLLNFHQAVTYASGFAAQLREGESK